MIKHLYFSSLFFFFNFLMLSIKDWTSLVQSLVDSGCTISAEVKVRFRSDSFSTFFFFEFFNAFMRIQKNFISFSSNTRFEKFKFVFITFWKLFCYPFGSVDAASAQFRAKLLRKTFADDSRLSYWELLWLDKLCKDEDRLIFFEEIKLLNITTLKVWKDS